MAIRERNPDGFCFDVNGPMRFKDIYYKERNLEPREREFLVDDQQIDREKLGEKLPYLGQKLEWDDKAKQYKPLEGKMWGTTAKGYEVGKYLYDKSEKKFLPKYKDGKRVLVEEIAEVMKEPFVFKFPQWWFPLKRQKSVLVWEETEGCPKGQVRIIYSGGKSSKHGMSNGPEDESGASAPVHTYHAIKNTKLANDARYQEAAKKALCEVPPVRLKCTGGKSPKCIDVDWKPPPPPKPKFPRVCGFLNPKPPVPTPPPVLTWQIARQSVGGVCKTDSPPPGSGVDEKPDEERAG
ncbi:unnamed protein product [Durusdinium trenchii]